MTVGNDTLYFTYGVFGPSTVTWNGTTYYYAVNGQGDVTGIFDSTGNCVVFYNLGNAWGYNPQPEGSLANTLGTLNPLRYRGYVYDTETGYYYLQSRYYDPGIGRFINADSSVSTGQGFMGNNMFAYCLNNPVNGCDPCGNCFHHWDFWNDCDKCGGKTIGDRWSEVTTWCVDTYNRINSINQQQIALDTQIIIKQNEMIADAADALGDAYMHGYNLQQEAIMLQAKSNIDMFDSPE